MVQFFLEGTTSGGEKLILSPLPDRIIAASEHEISDTSGHFLYLKPDSLEENITILAQVFSETAIFELGQLLDLK